MEDVDDVRVACGRLIAIDDEANSAICADNVERIFDGYRETP